MSVEIRELVIRAVVGSTSGSTGGDPGVSDAVLDEIRQASLQMADDETTTAIIDECVRQVLRELDRRGER